MFERENWQFFKNRITFFFYKEGTSVPVYTFEGKNELSRHTWEGKSAAKLVEWKYDEFYRLERNFEGVWSLFSSRYLRKKRYSRRQCRNPEWSR